MSKKTVSATKKATGDKDKFEYKEIRPKRKISEANAVKAMEKMVEVLNLNGISAGNAERLSPLVGQQKLLVDDSGVVYRLSRPIKDENGKQQRDFVLREPSSGELDKAEIDIIEFSQGLGVGDIDKDKADKLCYLMTGIHPELGGQVSMTDMAHLWLVFIAFFLGQ
jgi:hypothetical protein